MRVVPAMIHVWNELISRSVFCIKTFRGVFYAVVPCYKCIFMAQKVPFINITVPSRPPQSLTIVKSL